MQPQEAIDPWCGAVGREEARDLDALGRSEFAQLSQKPRRSRPGIYFGKDPGTLFVNVQQLP